MNDVPYRIALGVLCLLGLGIRAYYHLRSGSTPGPVSYREGRASVAFQRACGLVGLALVTTYLICPSCLAWARLPLPGWLRWAGGGGAAAGLALLWWTHHALGANFDSVLHAREDHTLVTSGPYRWVRHPMYTAMYLITASVALLSGVWLIGLHYWASLTVVLFLRLQREEALMSETFGEQYRAYMRRTGRFLPRLFRAEGDKP